MGWQDEPKIMSVSYTGVHNIYAFYISIYVFTYQFAYLTNQVYISVAVIFLLKKHAVLALG